MTDIEVLNELYEGIRNRQKALPMADVGTRDKLEAHLTAIGAAIGALKREQAPLFQHDYLLRDGITGTIVAAAPSDAVMTGMLRFTGRGGVATFLRRKSIRRLVSTPVPEPKSDGQ